MNSIARVTGFASQISATVHCLPPSNRKSVVEFAKKAEKILLEPRPAVNGSCRLAKAYLSPTGCVNQRATVGLTCRFHCCVTCLLAGGPLESRNGLGVLKQTHLLCTFSFHFVFKLLVSRNGATRQMQQNMFSLLKMMVTCFI